MKGKIWTEEEDNWLKQHWSSPPDIEKLGIVIKRTESAIRARAQRLELEVRTRSQIAIDNSKEKINKKAEKFLEAYREQRVERRALIAADLDHLTYWRLLKRDKEFAEKVTEIKLFLSSTLK